MNKQNARRIALFIAARQLKEIFSPTAISEEFGYEMSDCAHIANEIGRIARRMKDGAFQVRGMRAGFVIPGAPGYVIGKCGHWVARSEWRAGLRMCERCPEPEV